MLYRDEKLKQIIQKQMRIVWKTAAASRERSWWWGSLATLAWIACVVHLPPVQRAKSPIPHVIALCAAQSIAATIKESMKKAADTQKSIIEIKKDLKKAQNGDELHKIHRRLGKLEDQFIIKSYDERS